MKLWLCFFGFHDWHKYKYATWNIQTDEKRQCERCFIVEDGYAKKDHPDFRVAQAI